MLISIILDSFSNILESCILCLQVAAVLNFFCLSVFCHKCLENQIYIFILFIYFSLDCVKHDPDVNEEMEKNFVSLLSEELKLREAESAERQRLADLGLLEAKKGASQFQKEADKCNSGMETCEEARERAEADLVEQRKLSAVWEARAREKGWKDGEQLKAQL